MTTIDRIKKLLTDRAGVEFTAGAVTNALNDFTSITKYKPVPRATVSRSLRELYGRGVVSRESAAGKQSVYRLFSVPTERAFAGQIVESAETPETV